MRDAMTSFQCVTQIENRVEAGTGTLLLYLLPLLLLLPLVLFMMIITAVVCDVPGGRIL